MMDISNQHTKAKVCPRLRLCPHLCRCPCSCRRPHLCSRPCRHPCYSCLCPCPWPFSMVMLPSQLSSPCSCCPRTLLVGVWLLPSLGRIRLRQAHHAGVRLCGRGAMKDNVPRWSLWNLRRGFRLRLCGFRNDRSTSSLVCAHFPQILLVLLADLMVLPLRRPVQPHLAEIAILGTATFWTGVVAVFAIVTVCICQRHECIDGKIVHANEWCDARVHANAA